MAQSSGRITCARCGANNFDTVTVCWKCGVPLQVNTAPVMQSSPMSAPPMSAAPMYPPVERERPAHVPMSYPAPVTGDRGVATRAAIALALTLPWIGLPVGWIFMMIEDQSRQAIGRICVVWSLIALVFHFLLMFVAAQALGSLAVRLIGPIMGAMQGAANAGSGGKSGSLEDFSGGSLRNP